MIEQLGKAMRASKLWKSKKKSDVVLQFVIRTRDDVRPMLDCLEEIKKLHPGFDIRAEIKDWEF